MERMNELAAPLAAHNLALKVPDTDAAYWRSFLANNRKKGRIVAHPIPFRKVGRHVFYDRDDLATFAASEKARRAAIRAASSSHERGREGGGKGFRWTVEARQGDGRGRAVRLKLSGFTLAMPLTSTQARELAKDLLRFAEILEKTEGN